MGRTININGNFSTMERGAFIVLEGLDRAGKSTQVNLLIDALKKRSIVTEKRGFPDRTTHIGKLINDHLTQKIELVPEVSHLLFSSNRWECQQNIKDQLMNGTTLITDRYAGSGAAYSGAYTNQSLEWCKAPDKGLPAPDLVIYLDVKEETQMSRTKWGKERFERVELQRKVAENFQKLVDDTWYVVDANESVEKVHTNILEKALFVIQSSKNKPIGTLYK